jgi:hypothetical protein
MLTQLVQFSFTHGSGDCRQCDDGTNPNTDIGSTQNWRQLPKSK